MRTQQHGTLSVEGTDRNEAAGARVIVTELLKYPVLALSSQGIDTYATERDLATCHRRSVRSSYEGLRIIDGERDLVLVESYKVHPLPARPAASGGLSRDLVWVELSFSDPTRLKISDVRDILVEALKGVQDGPSVEDVSAAKSMSELCELFSAG